jgi:hypothetical protein
MALFCLSATVLTSVLFIHLRQPFFKALPCSQLPLRSLERIFQELPSCTSDPVRPAMLYEHHTEPSHQPAGFRTTSPAVPQLHLQLSTLDTTQAPSLLPDPLPAASLPAQLSTTLHMLPESVMELLVAKHLDCPRDLARLSCTCCYMRALAQDVAPGLHLSLYPHQVR